jgi:hypothetical protein
MENFYDDDNDHQENESIPKEFWRNIAAVLGKKSAQACRMRWERVLDPRLKKGLWSPDEDERLKACVKLCKTNNRITWRDISNAFKGTRSAKQCRERWKTVLDPSINKSPVTEKEEQEIIQLRTMRHWSFGKIAKRLGNNRTDAFVKNVWHSYLRRLKSQPPQIPEDCDFQEFFPSVVKATYIPSPEELKSCNFELDSIGEVTFESIFDSFDLPVLV